MTVKYYDPYYIIDPTTQREVIPSQGRTNDGRFSSSLVTNNDNDNNYPIDSRLWSWYAKGVIGRVMTDKGRNFADAILPDEVFAYFSWRMICEMYEAARDAYQAGKTDEEAIAAAHEWLTKKQRETAAKLPEGTEPSPVVSGGEIVYPPCVSPSTLDDETPF